MTIWLGLGLGLWLHSYAAISVSYSQNRHVLSIACTCQIYFCYSVRPALILVARDRTWRVRVDVWSLVCIFSKWQHIAHIVNDLTGWGYEFFHFLLRSSILVSIRIYFTLRVKAMDELVRIRFLVTNLIGALKAFLRLGLLIFDFLDCGWLITQFLVV